MKYMINYSELYDIRSISISSGDDKIIGFPVEVNNPYYDQFLVDAQLTDEEVHSLTPDTWFDFPKASK